MRRETWAAVLLAGATSQAVGQTVNDPQLPPDRVILTAVENTFGKNAARVYSGTISWTWNTGDAIESVEVGVIQGKVHCVVTYTTPESTFSASGSGLIDISLGLPPDEDAPEGLRKGKWYSLRVACPSAAPDAHPGARWSHSQDTYKVLPDSRPTYVRIPQKLKGTWTAAADDGSEHTNMTWTLCQSGCPPPPPRPER